MSKQLRQTITPTHMLGSTGTDVGSNLGHCSLGALPALTSTSTVTATKLVPTGNVTAGNGMYLPAANTVAFSTDGSERMRITSAGNVGIGTSSPGAVLHLSNTTTTDIGLRIDRNSSERANILGVFDGLWLNGAQVIRAATGGTERLRITGAGNVGIGLTSPNVSLEVAGNIHVSGGDRTIFNRSNNSLRFGTNNAGRMTIAANGNILLGSQTSIAGLPAQPNDFAVGYGFDTRILGARQLSLADAGTIDLPVNSFSVAGILIVNSIRPANSAFRTKAVYVAIGRANDWVFELLKSVDGASGGSSFTLAGASGTITATNTSGQTVNMTMSFFGTRGE